MRLLRLDIHVRRWTTYSSQPPSRSMFAFQAVGHSPSSLVATLSNDRPIVSMLGLDPHTPADMVV